MKNSGTLNVNSGGYLYLYGNEGTLSTLTGITPADRYSFNVNPGGWMLTNHTVFENMDDQESI
ncbi:MAG: hypothetical protein IPH20_12430 [Bacteroidales bacterium]|nr:hypothetical protein [Bacteroidales bacterium]